MRPVLISDLVHAARVLLQVQKTSRVGFTERLIREADWADRFRKHLGRIHPEWGDGTLSSAAARYPKAAEQNIDNLEFSKCLSTVLCVLRQRRGAN